ncbi:hypothetical protein BJ742DRAFT_181590 [Cladochytrium replicatum]|nr:hypothetical protein BJ742DRAFT_181590 [Cladochytrium replicatum]
MANAALISRNPSWIFAFAFLVLVIAQTTTILYLDGDLAKASKKVFNDNVAKGWDQSNSTQKAGLASQWSNLSKIAAESNITVSELVAATGSMYNAVNADPWFAPLTGALINYCNWIRSAVQDPTVNCGPSGQAAATQSVSAPVASNPPASAPPASNPSPPAAVPAGASPGARVAIAVAVCSVFASIMALF